MMVIEVDERGGLKVDSVEKSIEQFDQHFLEGLVEESLAGKVEYKIEGATPIAKFFKTIEEGTAPESDLKKLQEEVAAIEAANKTQNGDEKRASEKEALHE